MSDWMITWRPYYIYTPRNMYGESQVGPSIHQPPYEIRAVHTGQVAHIVGKDLQLLKLQTKELNVAHEISLAYAAYI
jgi:hypothetical protein